MEHNYCRHTENDKEYIICAAIHFEDDIIYVHQPQNIFKGFVICGRRHHNCFTMLSILGKAYTDFKVTQGFVTSKDQFVDRKEAGKIAFAAEQTDKLEETLFSEDLY